MLKFLTQESLASPSVGVGGVIRLHVLLRAGLAGLLLLPALAFCQTLTLAASRGPVSLLIYVAEARKLFQQEGADVQVRDCNSGRECVDMLNEGHADFATAAEVVVSLNSLRRNDDVIVATISASSHQIKLVARRSSAITDAKSMEGKRVGTVAGTSAQYFLDSWLLFYGIDPSTIKTVSMAPNQLPGALQRNELDAIVVWEPFASAAMKALSDGAVELPNPRVYNQYFSLVTTLDMTAHRTKQVTEVLKALINAQKFVENYPAETLSILSARAGTDPALASARMTEHDYRVRLDQALVNTMSSQVRWALGQRPRVTDKSPSAERDMVDPTILRLIRPEAVTTVR